MFRISTKYLKGMLLGINNNHFNLIETAYVLILTKLKTVQKYNSELTIKIIILFILYFLRYTSVIVNSKGIFNISYHTFIHTRPQKSIKYFLIILKSVYFIILDRNNFESSKLNALI